MGKGSLTTVKRHETRDAHLMGAREYLAQFRRVELPEPHSAILGSAQHKMFASEVLINNL